MAEWTYIIVGAGSAGCVLANRLSEDPENKVLLLEAGRKDNSLRIQIPALEPFAFGNPKFDWCYQAEQDPSRNSVAPVWPAGKVLGGGSSINGMIYIRGSAADYDSWAQDGVEGWSWSEVLPFFRKAETNSRGPSEVHGDDGPLSVIDMQTHHPLNDLFIKAAVTSGLSYNDDFNDGDQNGVGKIQTTQRRGFRYSTAKAYLKPAVSRPNLRVITNANAEQIVFEGRQAVGVSYRHEGKEHLARCSQEVLVSCGAIGSPALLLRSGVGDATELRAVGVEVVADIPAVGQNLQEHPGSYLRAEVDLKTFNVQFAPHHAIRHGLNWILNGRGPLTSPAATCCAFLKTDPKLEEPDIQVHFSPFSYDYTPGGKFSLPKVPTILLGVNVSRPQSRGYVTLSSPKANVPPVIHHELWSNEQDFETIQLGLLKTHEILKSAPLAKHVVNSTIDEAIGARASLQEYVRENSFMAYHPVGTCAMGNRGVLSSDLRVKGLGGLRVVDASAMPRVPSGNTNAPVIMLAEKAAALISES